MKFYWNQLVIRLVNIETDPSLAYRPPSHPKATSLSFSGAPKIFFALGPGPEACDTTME
jgi:hypothetical protein